MSGIRDFNEDEIRIAILNKAPLKNINKGGKHWKGYIYSGDVLIAKVKIPNDHRRIMHSNKSQHIAQSLKLDDEAFNRFVECTLKRIEYEKYLETFK